jgi:hypothetical protein
MKGDGKNSKSETRNLKWEELRIYGKWGEGSSQRAANGLVPLERMSDGNASFPADASSQTCPIKLLGFIKKEMT